MPSATSVSEHDPWRVLIVDDDQNLAQILAEALTGSDCHASTAEDAATARAKMDELHPDLIILDLMLPDADGLAVWGYEDVTSGRTIDVHMNA